MTSFKLLDINNLSAQHLLTLYGLPSEPLQYVSTPSFDPQLPAQLEETLFPPPHEVEQVEYSP
ncbi:MAG: hypothetical protein ABJB05_13850 [Parafilimonas sp.]